MALRQRPDRRLAPWLYPAALECAGPDRPQYCGGRPLAGAQRRLEADCRGRLCAALKVCWALIHPGRGVWVNAMCSTSRCSSSEENAGNTLRVETAHSAALSPPSG